MHEDRGLAGGGERRRHFAGDEAGLANAGDDRAAGRGQQHRDRLFAGVAKRAGAGRGERLLQREKPFALDGDGAQRRRRGLGGIAIHPRPSNTPPRNRELSAH